MRRHISALLGKDQKPNVSQTLLLYTLLRAPSKISDIKGRRIGPRTRWKVLELFWEIWIWRMLRRRNLRRRIRDIVGEIQGEGSSAKFFRPHCHLSLFLSLCHKSWRKFRERDPEPVFPSTLPALLGKPLCAKNSIAKKLIQSKIKGTSWFWLLFLKNSMFSKEIYWSYWYLPFS